MTPSQKRIAAASIAATIAAASPLIATLKKDEGFTVAAVQPVHGDRWTYGHGSTFKPDGSPVQSGDRISRIEADQLLRKTVADKYEAGINRCAGDIPVFPREKDVLIEIAYQNGVAGVCSYSIIDKFRAGQYEAGCISIMTIDKLQGRHCAKPENRYRKDGCNGLMNRRERQMKSCLGVV